MPNKIERLCSVTGSIVATASASTTPKIPFGAASGGTLIVDGVTGGAATLTWYVAFGPEGTAVPIQSSGAVTTTISAGNAYPLPEALFGAPFIAAVADVGTATFRISVKG
jgi:hypothetical protein